MLEEQFVEKKLKELLHNELIVEISKNQSSLSNGWISNIFLTPKWTNRTD